MHNSIRKIRVILAALILMLALTGCSYVEDIVVSKNGKVDVSMTSWCTADEFKLIYSMAGMDSSALTEEQIIAMLKQSGEYVGKKVGKDGLTYYGTVEEKENAEDSVVDNPAYIVSENEFVFYSAVTQDELTAEAQSLTGDVPGVDASALDSLMSLSVNITLPKKIVLTNGTLSKDKKTASFEQKLSDPDATFYAYTAGSDKIIMLDGLTGENSTKAKKISVSTFDKVKSITVNGTAQKSKKIATPEDGIYKIDVVTRYSTRSFTIIRDTKKPTVSGVKNKKTYSKNVTIRFSDADSGILSAELNGEPITNKTKVTKNGSYTLVVTDNAGNVRTVNFTIKK